MPLRWKLRFLVGKALYRLGLTHRFKCRECGWPTLERPVGQYWRWYCPNCGWDAGPVGHVPRVMKKQHRLVGWLRLFWRELWA
jgi:ribosomal protein L37AE/L43A